jgi:hypothetical protein
VQYVDKDVWNFKTAKQRLDENPLPSIHIIFNDHQVGFVHNNGRKFSDEAFKVFVSGLAIAKGCKKIRFILGFNRHGKKEIRYAVLYF